MKTLLISLISDQTIPNILIINEFRPSVTDFLFISTPDMEIRKTRLWIENTCKIQGSFLVVDQFSFSDIEKKISTINYDEYEKIIVNATGGTKVMSLVVVNFYKELGADIYYVTGKNDNYIKIHPIRKSNIFSFKEKITLSDYLTAYGFQIEKSNRSGISFEQTKRLFDNYCNINIHDYIEPISFILEKRSKKKEVKTDEDFLIIADYLKTIAYDPITENRLSKDEIKYLSGDWFEEYVGYTIQKELGLTDEDLFIGAVIKKEVTKEPKNKVEKLLNELDLTTNFDNTNEMDVMFVYNNEFYSIECKTSIIALKYENEKWKEINILGETIYKSDSLKSRFGLYPKTSILTLTDFNNYCIETDKKINKNKAAAIVELINRANLSNIKLIDLSLIQSSGTLFEIIKQL